MHSDYSNLDLLDKPVNINTWSYPKKWGLARQLNLKYMHLNYNNKTWQIDKWITITSSNTMENMTYQTNTLHTLRLKLSLRPVTQKNEYQYMHYNYSNHDISHKYRTPDKSIHTNIQTKTLINIQTYTLYSKGNNKIKYL